MKSLWEIRGWPLYVMLFFAGFIEDFAYLGWLSLATHGYVITTAVFVYLWHSLHDLYYSIPNTVWQDKRTRRAEKLGSALGAGLSLYLFPLR